MKVSFLRRLQVFWSGILRYQKGILIGIVLSVFIWLIEQIIGSAIWDFLKPFFQNLAPPFVSIIKWILNHPAGLFNIVLVIVVVSIILKIYLESRPVSGIRMGTASTLDVRLYLGIYEGIKVANNRGEDIINCYVNIIGVAGKKLHNRIRAMWDGQNSEPIEMHDGEERTAYIIYRWNGTMRATLVSPYSVGGIPLSEGDTEIELWFHANTRGGRTLTMPVWADVNITLVDDKHEITIKKVTS